MQELHPYAASLHTRTPKYVLQKMYEQKLDGTLSRFINSASQTEVQGPYDLQSTSSASNHSEVQVNNNNPLKNVGIPASTQTEGLATTGTPDSLHPEVQAAERPDHGYVPIVHTNQDLPSNLPSTTNENPPNPGLPTLCPSTGAAEISAASAWTSDPPSAGFSHQPPTSTAMDLLARAMDTMADLAKAVSTKVNRDTRSTFTLDTAIKATMASPGAPPISAHSDYYTTNAPTASNFGVPMSSLPHVELVSMDIQEDILKGKDINLSTLLIPNYTPQAYCDIIIGQEAVPLKPLTDSRLNRQLTISEFIHAFSIYKGIMCRKFPFRRTELDLYERSIIDMHSRFGGNIFYEYHRAFSARAAQYLQIYNVKVDWSVRDNDLFCAITAGSKPQACPVCNSLSHTTMFCGQVDKSNASNSPSKARHTYNGVEICLKFNQGRFIRNPCIFVHRCSLCKSTQHGAHNATCRSKPRTTTTNSSSIGEPIPTVGTSNPTTKV